MQTRNYTGKNKQGKLPKEQEMTGICYDEVAKLTKESNSRTIAVSTKHFQNNREITGGNSGYVKDPIISQRRSRTSKKSRSGKYTCHTRKAKKNNQAKASTNKGPTNTANQ